MNFGIQECFKGRLVEEKEAKKESFPQPFAAKWNSGSIPLKSFMFKSVSNSCFDIHGYEELKQKKRG